MRLVQRWGAGDFRELPPVEVVSSSAMPTAAGAYAISTGTIYLNSGWLVGASRDQALAVLTEELGHHLDALLNNVDTPGDEGELFAALLTGSSGISDGRKQMILAENDLGSAWLGGADLVVEQAVTLSATPIAETIPGRTSGEVRNSFAFAVLKGDGSVVTWGDSANGGYSVPVAGSLNAAVSQIFSTSGAYAALKSDGSVVTWGNPDLGGFSGAVASKLSSGVTQIFSNPYAFAALKSDGSVVTWGHPAYGSPSPYIASQLTSGVTQISSTAQAFAAIKNDGSVVTWGDSGYGADSSTVASQLSSGVAKIYATERAFAALKNDGSVITWGGGPGTYGGDSGSVASKLSSGVTQIFSNPYAFAALKSDGSVVTWGYSPFGGSSSPTLLASGVTQIFSTSTAFAALKNNGSVVTWGGWGGDSSAVATKLSSGVVQIFANESAFAALKSDGSVVTWGSPSNGGDSSTVAGQLVSGVSQIVSNQSAFAALKSNGSVIVWGDASSGGDNSAVISQLTAGVSQLFSNGSAFVAIKTDGSVISWGNATKGGNSSAVASQLANLASHANPFADDRLNTTDASPLVTLAVSPASVLEDGSSNLIYTFSRTGPTSSPLTIHYTVSGTATLGTDFTGIPSTGTIKTITIAPGSSTASLSLDPIAEALTETDETVALSLISGIGYTIGTTSPVVATILSDDNTFASISNVTDDFGLIQGTVATGGITDDPSPLINGVLSAPLASGESLAIYNGTTFLGFATVSGQSWSFTPMLPSTASTTYTLTARISSSGGALGLASTARSFVLDTLAPGTSATITSVMDDIGLSQGQLAQGASTDDASPTISGTLLAALNTGETLSIFNGSSFLGTAVIEYPFRARDAPMAKCKPVHPTEGAEMQR
jgi:alpha-tubulin suppressor-like RCC1 family protein